jgi:site-specific recombinase XerD
VKRDNELYPFRRHLRACNFFGPGGREIRADKCDCPFHVDGLHHGKRVRQSLRTTSRQLADRRLTSLIRTLDEQSQDESVIDELTPGNTPLKRTVLEAIERFLKSHGTVDSNRGYHGDIEYSSYRKYRTKLRLLRSFCDQEGISELADVNLEVLEDYRRSRDVGAVTWKVELQALRTFFGYCVTHKWISANPAMEMKSPRNIKPNEVVPYTLREEAEILEACDRIGGARYKRSAAVYERLRAKAMILLLRHTALRISDVCTLRKDAVTWDPDCGRWRVFLRTQKSGEPVYLPIPDGLKLALDALPLPRQAAQDCPWYFWNGQTAERAVVGIAERSVGAVFKKSKVKNAHAHRYRHTLATRLLGDGARFQEVADILGNTEAVVRKHYGKWSKKRQANIDRLMIAHFQTATITGSVTPESHEKTGSVN